MIEVTPLLSFVLVDIISNLALLIISFAVAFRLVNVSNADSESRAFGLAWLFIAPIGLLAAISNFLYWSRSAHLFLTTETILQVFAVLDVVFVFYYFLVKILGVKKINYYIISVHSFLMLAFVYFFFSTGAQVSSFSLYGAEYSLPPAAQLLFLLIVAPPFLLNLYDFILRFFKVVIAKNIEEKNRLLASSSLLIFGVAGILDQLALTANWPHMVIRISMVMSAIIAYFCYENIIKDKAQI